MLAALFRINDLFMYPELGDPHDGLSLPLRLAFFTLPLASFIYPQATYQVHRMFLRAFYLFLAYINTQTNPLYHRAHRASVVLYPLDGQCLSPGTENLPLSNLHKILFQCIRICACHYLDVAEDIGERVLGMARHWHQDRCQLFKEADQVVVDEQLDCAVCLSGDRTRNTDIQLPGRFRAAVTLSPKSGIQGLIATQCP